ncbi:multivesicular body subunit 12B [Sitophilus oryzae]|uniref:Multivesicular body subunit 12A n=1 Tax=Sitophilus oryzae TaxID=7048 RepID=A0A6J2XT34_SITOR|nr:multivesicular body subunit 12B [Sitophilus oryzae]XP_030754678.1 multivesicular body subunit 12B [Sitophilus oryzae]
MLKSALQSKLLQTLPDDRPVTALQIVENVEKCPRGFYPIIKTYDQDSDADLGEKSIFKSSSGRYLCISKSEGLPNFVVQEIFILNEKASPPKGFSLLNRTADTSQKAWKKKQICYRLVNLKETKTAITDIIICSRLKKAPSGFSFAGDLNGVTLCYKMGNTESTQNGTAPDRPPKPMSPNSNNMYPSLGESDHDYEILRPGPGYGPPGPIRPAPKPPAPAIPVNPMQPSLQHQNSTHTLGNSTHFGLEGVPFVVNPKFLSSSGDSRFQLPKIKTKTMQQILKEYDYTFTVERQAQ